MRTIITGLLICCLVPSAAQANGRETEFIEDIGTIKAGELLVKVKGGVSNEDVHALFRSYGVKQFRQYKPVAEGKKSPMARWWRVTLRSEQDTAQVKRQLANDSIVETVEFSHEVSIQP